GRTRHAFDPGGYGVLCLSAMYSFKQSKHQRMARPTNSVHTRLRIRILSRSCLTTNITRGAFPFCSVCHQVRFWHRAFFTTNVPGFPCFYFAPRTPDFFLDSLRRSSATVAKVQFMTGIQP
ncbi:hypothetical protein JI435_423170, partial [Parastagonospora nodorum SN15]